MTIPNLITSLRILLTPVFIIYLINGDLTAALIFFVLAGISDAVDGAIARLFNQKSTLGAFLDPLADKILLASAFIMLAAKGYIYAWLSVIVISRDIMISLGVLILFFNHQRFEIKPTFYSKITTCVQLICVFAVLASNYYRPPTRVMEGLFWVTALFTVLSGLHYVYRWFQMMSKGPLHD